MKKNKTLKLLCILFFLSPLHLFAQQDLTGLWKGKLYNDTTKEYLFYELAISNDNGKLTGYSYTVFKGANGDEIGVKTIKVKRVNDKIIIEDISLINNTYAADAPTKKVRKLLTVTLTDKDSVMVMSGNWITNWVGKFRPVTGTVEVEKKNYDWKEEPLLKKLDTMKLAATLSFNQPEKKESLTAVIVKPTETTTVIEKKPVKQKPTLIADSSKTVAVAKPMKKIKKPEKITTTTTTPVKNSSSAITTNSSIKRNAPVVIIPPAAEAAVRKTQTIQSIEYASDSLVLSIYDNGIIDGDTVSILLNGGLIFSKTGLLEKPTSKTIYTKDIPDSTQLIWYAENLGTIPPNTGLLILMDGKTRHEIFFSADLQTNAAIILRRKKKV